MMCSFARALKIVLTWFSYEPHLEREIRMLRHAIYRTQRQLGEMAYVAQRKHEAPSQGKGSKWEHMHKKLYRQKRQLGLLQKIKNQQVEARRPWLS